MNFAAFRRLAAATAGVLVALFSTASAAENEHVGNLIRAQAASLPRLEPSLEAGSAKFTVIRLNATPIMIEGERYGAIRIECPPGKPLSLAWMFSDTMNIDEYEFIPLHRPMLEFGAQRRILPATANADPELERPGRPIMPLPRPWDVFQLHLWGVPATVLDPGEQYLVWFRFSDSRATDMLFAATFVDQSMRVHAIDLPAIFGLVDLSEP